MLFCKKCYIIFYQIRLYHIVEGGLEVRLPTIWTDEKKRKEEDEAWRKSEGRR